MKTNEQGKQWIAPVGWTWRDQASHVASAIRHGEADERHRLWWAQARNVIRVSDGHGDIGTDAHPAHVAVIAAWCAVE